MLIQENVLMSGREDVCKARLELRHMGSLKSDFPVPLLP